MSKSSRSKLSKSAVQSKSASTSGKYREVIQNGTETTFSSTPTDGWSYGVNRDIERYFSDHTNIDEILKNLSPDAQSAWRHWFRGDLMSGLGTSSKSASQTTWDDLSPREQEWVRHFDKTIDESVYHEPVVIKTLGGYGILTGNRSVPSDAEWSSIVGRPVKLNMPVSSAAASEGLTIGRYSKNVEYSWHVPAGVKGVAVPGVHYKINSAFESEQRENILNRDRFWKPGERKYNKKRGVWEISMYYVGADRHYYGKK